MKLKFGSKATGPMRILWTALTNQRNLLVLVVFFSLASRLVMAVIVPPWQGPDEPKHFEYMRMLVDKRSQLWNERRLLNLDDAVPEFQREVIASMARNHFWEYWGQNMPVVLPKSYFEIWQFTSTQLHRPSLYYFVGAAGLLPFQGASLELQLLVARLISGVLSTLAVVITFAVGRELMPKDRFVPLVSAAFVGFLPMHVFMGGTVNSDNMITFWGSLVALGVTMGLRRGFTVRRLAFLFGSLALAVSTKRTAVGLLPVALLALPIWLSSLPFRTVFYAGAGLILTGGLVLMGIVSGWIGQIVRLDSLRELAMAYALNEADQLDRLLGVPFASANAQGLILSHLAWLFRSFWGVFGWFSLHLTSGLYGAITWVSLTCAVGFFAWLAFQVGDQIRRPNQLRGSQILTFVAFVVAIASMVVLAVGERLPYFQPGQIPQGRYLFVAVAPIAAIYAVGARAFIPRRFLRTPVPALLAILALIILDLVILTRVLLPFYAWQVFT